MLIKNDFRSYEPWSGAISTYARIEDAGKLDALECILDDLYPDGMTACELNDLLWFDSDWILESLGLPTEESLYSEIQDLKDKIEELYEMCRFDVKSRIEESEGALTQDDYDEIWGEIWAVDYADDFAYYTDEISELQEEIDNL